MKRKIKKKVWIFCFIGIAFVTAFCLFNLLLWHFENKKSEKLNNEILDNVIVDEIKDDGEALIDNNIEEDIYRKYFDVSLIDVDLNELKNQNNDTIGWIQVMGTTINYPVVQSSDNEHYLTHDFLNEPNNGGWIFLDYRNDINNLEYNTIIYGHRRFNTDVMFGSLKNTLDEDWFNNYNNHIIKISATGFSYVFQIFSAYITTNENSYLQTDFATKSEYEEFLKMIQERSKFDFKVELNGDDKIITLSTCHNTDDRLVVHGKLIKQVEKTN